MHPCIHRSIHSCIHQYTHACIHTPLHACIRVSMHTGHFNTCMRACVHMCICAHVHTSMLCVDECLSYNMRMQAQLRTRQKHIRQPLDPDFIVPGSLPKRQRTQGQSNSVSSVPRAVLVSLPSVRASGRRPAGRRPAGHAREVGGDAGLPERPHGGVAGSRGWRGGGGQQRDKSNNKRND